MKMTMTMTITIIITHFEMNQIYEKGELYVKKNNHHSNFLMFQKKLKFYSSVKTSPSVLCQPHTPHIICFYLSLAGLISWRKLKGLDSLIKIS